MTMIARAIILVVFTSLMVSCRKAPETSQVTETRRLTMWDHSGDPLIAPMPPEWRQVPSTQLRIYNYRFGEGSQGGEVYISRASGGVLPNANRWLKQFGAQEVPSVGAFPKVKMLGLDAVVVAASGKFGGAMGRAEQDNAGVLGVIADTGNGLITVKMIGNGDAVSAERERMLKFCENLRIREINSASSKAE